MFFISLFLILPVNKCRQAAGFKEKAMVLTSLRENLNDSELKTFVLMNVKNSIP